MTIKCEVDYVYTIKDPETEHCFQVEYSGGNKIRVGSGLSVSLNQAKDLVEVLNKILAGAETVTRDKTFRVGAKVRLRHALPEFVGDAGELGVVTRMEVRVFEVQLDRSGPTVRYHAQQSDFEVIE